MFMHKVNGNKLPASMKNLFKIANNEIENQHLRSSVNDFLLRKPKTNYIRKVLPTITNSVE